MIIKANRFSILDIFLIIIYVVLIFLDLKSTPLNDFTQGLMLGISLGCIIVSFVSTAKYGAKVKAFKLRILQKGK